MRQRLANSFGTKNLKMDDKVYKLRRQVIDLIYEAKEVVDLPRITVRVTDDHKTMLACATLSKNVMWVTTRVLKGSWDLRMVIYHEIAHAVYGTQHDENCKLMKANLNKTERMSKKQAQKILKGLVK